MARARNIGIRQDPDKLRRVIALFNGGSKYKTIADEFNVSVARIQQIIRRLSTEGLVSGYPRNTRRVDSQRSKEE